KNSPVYHYCGVCGAVLQGPKEEPAAKPVPVASAPIAPPVAVEPAPPAPVAAAPIPPPPPPSRMERGEMPVSGGMSFLGLSEASSSSSPTYLLDDEDEAERSVAWGRIFSVLLLLGAALGLGWQYHVHGYPFAPATSSQTAATPAPATPAPTPAPAQP